MCDTMVVVGEDRVLFAKNSDRDPNEGQGLEWHPRQSWPTGSTLRATHIALPQVAETHAVVISRPYWMWGAEMGTNEHGVTIGNEAVFTRAPYAASGLTGMDLVRLGLERGSTAREALDVMVELLERHGQGGGCGHERRAFTYHNSFLIADPRAAFVLETAGTHWAVEAVQGARAISNGLTIPEFAQRHADSLRGRVAACRMRRARAEAHARNAITPVDLARALRDHGEHLWPRYSMINGAFAGPCAHAGGLIAATQTTASWIAELRPGAAPRLWATATAAPCVSLFKPLRVDAPLDLPMPGERLDDTLWWQHERWHRRVMRAPQDLAMDFVQERDQIEALQFDAPTEPAAAFEAHREWLARLNAVLDRSLLPRDTRPRFVRRYWAVRNARAGLVI